MTSHVLVKVLHVKLSKSPLFNTDCLTKMAFFLKVGLVCLVDFRTFDCLLAHVFKQWACAQHNHVGL